MLQCQPQHHHHRLERVLRHILLISILGCNWPSLCSGDAIRVAVIGGGIGGTFVTKYLVDYHKDLCRLEALDIYDPVSEIGKEINLDDDNNDNEWQGSRVASVRLPDGRIVEVGASIGHTKFRYILEMIQNDPRKNITTTKPLSTGQPKETAVHLGVGIYHGQGQWPIVTANQSNFINKLHMVWRYHADLWKVARASSRAAYLFGEIHDQLDQDGDNHDSNNNDEVTNKIFHTPDEIWKSVDLYDLAHTRFDDLLDNTYFLSKELDLWHSSNFLRTELLTAINLCNYNQNNSQVNALVGLASFATSTDGNLFSIAGGNHQIMNSAFYQAQTNYEKYCPSTTITTDNNSSSSIVRHVSQRVTKVIARALGDNAFDLYGGPEENEFLGTYDIVILAAPLSMCRITFLQQSHMDEMVLTPMPLMGMIQPKKVSSRRRTTKQPENQTTHPNDEVRDHHHDHEFGHSMLPPDLPEFAKRPYTQVVTTLVSNAMLNTSFLQLDPLRQPKSIYMTNRGKEELFQITAISEISSVDGIYKIFSNTRLESNALVTIFGPQVQVLLVKVWGGPHGGATPDFQGQGSSLSFTLYRSGGGMVASRPTTTRGGLYYVNAMEGAFSCMENSAIGAKAVAKLVASDLGWISTTTTTTTSSTSSHPSDHAYPNHDDEF